MANAKEFRIGNVVLDKFGKTIIIESINESGINLMAGDGNGVYPDFEFEEIFKIPLTEEILLKCGFKAESNYDNFIFNKIEISSCIRVISTNERKSFWLVGKYEIPIEFLHQLQNLYFALTNEELILNL